MKSEAELESVRDSVRINERGFEIFLESYAPGKTAAEVMAAAEEWFVAEGCGRLTMNMVLTGTDELARPEFKIARREEVLGGFVLPSLEIAGPGMHWVEVSRAVAVEGSSLSSETERMMEAYVEYFERRRAAMRPGAACHDVHRAVSSGFLERGYHLGHVTGHSIGMTMIEFPKVGEGVETELRESMVLSMHPHAIAANGEDCLYMQETWLVTADGGEPLSSLPMQVFVRRSCSFEPRARRATIGKVSWPWLVLLASAAALVVAVESPRLASRFGADARRERARDQRRRRSFRVITPDDESDEFIRSVQRDLERCRRSRSATAGPASARRPVRAAADLSRPACGLAVRTVNVVVSVRVLRQDSRHVLGVLRLLVVGDLEPEAMPCPRDRPSVAILNDAAPERRPDGHGRRSSP